LSGPRLTIAVAAACAALVACADPDLPSDLKGSGPPFVTAVLVASDLRTSIDPDFPASPFDLDRLIETATHCRIGDVRRPAVVNLPTISTYQVCPDDLAADADEAGAAEAAPPSWYVRVVFDELLDPSIEDLVPELDPQGRPTGRVSGSVRAAHPVTLRCDGAELPYDGYYVPNGNRLSWPVGPALVIAPDEPAAIQTGAACEVTVNDSVHNKRGDAVPADQRRYAFAVAAMALRFTDPPPFLDVAPGTAVRGPGEPVRLFFTAAADPPPASAVHIASGPNLEGDAPDPSVCAGGGAATKAADVRVAVRPAIPDATEPAATTTDLVLELGLASGAWAPGTTYRVELAAGTQIAARQGGAPARFADGLAVCFHTVGA
jgi:hypothetical protein